MTQFALIFKNETAEYKEISNLLRNSCTVFKDIHEFDKIKKNFDYVYCPDPLELIKIQNKIPYIYDILPKTFSDEMNYYSFFKFYSQIGGPIATFVSDKKLNKNASWMHLNNIWINKSINTKIDFIQRKFFIPKLHIGYICQDKESFEIIKKIIYAKKENWMFHIYAPFEIDDSIKNKGTFFYGGEIERVKKDIFSKVHVFINLDLNLNNTSELFPDTLAMESMLSGAVLISSNNQGNNTHLLFDDFHYFKLDFTDPNTLLNTLRFVDKRREKLENMSREGSGVIKKYFDYREIALQKVKFLKKL